ncbi:PadR family transcriptional regulator [Maribellus sediminis]|uniref:PadR family transcriptional regulator n=1 Tax=Maribellus sediminis TaxID=2696285 RepID=UPI001432021E|nr:PadR family transcriptional regulator [Maribellus sediminis]
MSEVSKELMGASSIPLILSILKTGDTYGFEIMDKIKVLSQEKIIWKDGSLYPVLRKLEKAGLIKSYWKNEDNGGRLRRRRYYKIVDKGNKMLEKQKEEWAMMQSIFNELWNLQTFSTFRKLLMIG